MGSAVTCPGDVGHVQHLAFHVIHQWRGTSRELGKAGSAGLVQVVEITTTCNVSFGPVGLGKGEGGVHSWAWQFEKSGLVVFGCFTPPLPAETLADAPSADMASEHGG